MTGRLLRLYLLLPLLLSAPAGAPRAADPDPWLDVSERYETYLAEGRLDRDKVEAAFARVRGRLGSLRILFVPSWLSDTARAASGLGIIEYMDQQVAGLRRAGLAAQIVELDSEASVPANAQALERLVRAIDGRVCLVSHSKGGLDSLEFLLRTDPATRAKVACWIALQTPFLGSPYADLASDSELLRWVADELLAALGGSGRSLTDLRADVRRAYMETFDEDIAALTAKLPILSFASHLESPRLEGLPSYASSRLMSLLSGRLTPNDGLVAVESAILPHSRYIVAADIDHNMTVSSAVLLKSPLDRVLLTKLLLALVLTLDET